MAGQIIRRGERTFLVRAYLGRDGTTGKRRYHNHTVHGSKKDAGRYLNRVLRERDTNTFVEPSRQTVAEYLDHWLAAIRHRVRARTSADYDSLVTRYIKPALGGERLDRLSSMGIAQFYSSLSERGLSARTVRYTHSVLRSALQEALSLGLLARNPAVVVKLPSPQRKEMRALSTEQAIRFLDVAKENKWHGLWVLLLTTGLRPGEALGLVWSDVDLDQGKLRVQRVLVRIDGKGWSRDETKTERSRRTVTLPSTTVAVLRQHRAHQLEERMRIGPEYAGHEFVFATPEGEPLDYRAVVRRHFKPLLKKAGLPLIRPYDLRHSCATLLLAVGEHPKIVSERLGHSSTTLTMDTYSHVLPDMQQKAAEKLEGLLFPTAHQG